MRKLKVTTVYSLALFGDLILLFLSMGLYILYISNNDSLTARYSKYLEDEQKRRTKQIN